MDQLLYLALLIAASVFALNYYKKRSGKSEEQSQSPDEEQGE